MIGKENFALLLTFTEILVFFSPSKVKDRSVLFKSFINRISFLLLHVKRMFVKVNSHATLTLSIEKRFFDFFTKTSSSIDENAETWTCKTRMRTTTTYLTFRSMPFIEYFI